MGSIIPRPRYRSMAFDHVLDRLRVIANAALVHMTGLLEPDCDVPVAYPLASLRTRPTESLRQLDDVRTRLGVRLAPLALPAFATLPFPGATKLCHEAGLLELADGAEHLADEGRSRRIVDERAGAVGGDELDAFILQQPVAGFLDDEIAGEAVRRLDNDGTDPIRRDAFECRLKARPGVDRVGTGDRCIVKPVDDLDPGATGEALDRVALAFLTVLILTDVGRGAGTSNADRTF